MKHCDTSWKTANAKQKGRSKKPKTTIADSSDREADCCQRELGNLNQKAMSTQEIAGSKEQEAKR